ncbi:MAG: DUF624 domain-containing protein [Succinivibrio sp.]
MGNQKDFNPVVAFCNWTCRLCWIHVSFVAMSLCGLVVLGIFPALSTSCLMLRRYMNGRHSARVSEMAREYRKVFVKANLAGWAVALPSLSCLWYSAEGVLHLGAAPSIAAMALAPAALLGLALCYCTVVMLSCYEPATLRGALQNGLAAMMGRVGWHCVPFTLLALACLGVTYALIPASALFFGAAPALLTTVASIRNGRAELMGPVANWSNDANA